MDFTEAVSVALMTVSSPITRTKITIVTSLLETSFHPVVLAYDDSNTNPEDIVVTFPKPLKYELLALSFQSERYYFGPKIENFGGRWTHNPSRIGAFHWFSSSVYDYMWMFEDDTWSGDFGSFMSVYDSHQNLTIRQAAVVAKAEFELPFWYHDRWRVGDPSHGIQGRGRKAMINLCAFRVSREFAKAVVHEISVSRTTSHHEIYIPYVVQKRAFFWFELMPRHQRHLFFATHHKCEQIMTIAEAKKDRLSIGHPIKHVDKTDGPPPAFSFIVDDKTSWCQLVQHSTLHSVECSTQATTVLPFLVTGVGRSGSTYLASLLHRAGLRVSHDDKELFCPCPGEDGAVSWPHAFSTTRFSTSSGTRECPRVDERGRLWSYDRRRRQLGDNTSEVKGTRFEQVWHLVRDPLTLIKSRWNKGNLNAFGALDACNTRQVKTDKLSRDDQSLLRTLRHVVQWNLFVESYASRRLRVEDLSPQVAWDICATSSLKKCPDVGMLEEADAQLGKTVNSGHTVKDSMKMTWSRLSLLDAEMSAIGQQMALRYGYEVPEEDRIMPWFNMTTSCGFSSDDGRWGCALHSPRSTDCHFRVRQTEIP